MSKYISIIIPTYTGADTIEGCLSSILGQKSTNFDINIVIDGPNSKLRQLIGAHKPEFISKGIKFYIHQFEKNRGRFEARFFGAKHAKYENLLFIDDRCLLSGNYIAEISKADNAVVMANVKIGDNVNLIEYTLKAIRELLFARSRNQTLIIDSSNFEKYPKGTTSLLVNRNLFLEACNKFRQGSVGNTKSSSDDTKLLRLMVSAGHKIIRPARAIIYYIPRMSLRESISHLYERGPKFVDYYARPGTRYFAPMLIFLALALALAIAAIKFTVLVILAVLISAIVVALVLSPKIWHVPRVLIGFVVVVVIFSAGIFSGLYSMLAKANQGVS